MDTYVSSWSVFVMAATESIIFGWIYGKQGSHRHEKYLNIEDCLEKSLKMKFALKSTWKTLKGLAKSNLPFTGGFISVFGALNQYKIVAPLFAAAYASPNKGTTILY